MKKRMTIKKTAAAALAMTMAVSLIACGGSKTGETTGNTTTNAASENKEEAQAAGGKEELVKIASEGMETQIECEPIQLSLGCSGTVDGTVMGDAIKEATKAAKEWTNGNFVVNFFPSGQLGGDMELIEGAQMGSVDMFTGAPTSQVGLIPELAVLDIGGLYRDVDSANHVLEAFREQLEEYYNKVNLHLVSIYAPDFRILTANKPITSAADLQGLNIRVQENKYHIEFWKKLGTNPTPLAFGELYIALQQGMLDAEENPWASIVGAKLNEVQSYIVETNHIPFVTTYVMNQTKYENMSEGQKKACDQFVEFIKRYQLAGTAEDDARMSKLCQDEYGIEVTEVSEEIKNLYADASASVIEMMKESIDPAFVDSYVEAAQKASE